MQFVFHVLPTLKVLKHFKIVVLLSDKNDSLFVRLKSYTFWTFVPQDTLKWTGLKTLAKILFRTAIK